MAHILYENGKKIGEISEWVRTERLPVPKVVLGKSIVTQKLNDQCTFESPKAVNRKSVLSIIVDASERLLLKDIHVRAGTYVTATIAEQTKII